VLASPISPTDQPKVRASGLMNCPKVTNVPAITNALKNAIRTMSQP
jgi:hypothetical protein